MRSLLPENQKKNQPWNNGGHVNPKFTQFRLGDKDPSAVEWYRREPEAAIQWAKQQWMRGFARADILEETGLTPNQLSRLINGTKKTPGWKKEKGKIKAKAIERAILADTDRVGALVESTLDIIEKGVRHVADDLEGRLEEYGRQKARWVEGEKRVKAAVTIGEIEKVMKVTSQLFAMKKLGESLGIAITNNLTVNVNPSALVERLKAADQFGFGDVIDVTDDSSLPDVDIKRLVDE